jgi:hypothetical protein
MLEMHATKTSAKLIVLSVSAECVTLVSASSEAGGQSPRPG